MILHLTACLLAIAFGTAHAERLPVRVFTTADGLANNRVERGTQDVHGFLWFATGEGVSRFDGGRFESFGVADGLPGTYCHDIKATRDGRIWVATEAGLAVLDLDERMVRPRFRAVTSDESFRMTEDPSGVLWVGTTKGLVRIEQGAITEIPLPAGVLSIAFDPSDRSLWLATFSGLMHRTERGELTRFRIAPRGESDDRTFSVLVARDGTLWVGHVSPRLLKITLPLAPTTEPLAESTSSAVTVIVPVGGVRRAMMQDSSGAIWIGTTTYLERWNGTKLEEIRPSQIGSEGSPEPSLEDRDGNLWFGTDANGVVRLAKGGLVSYDTRDGLESPATFGFVQDPAGPFYAVTYNGRHAIARRDGEHFTSVTPQLPPDVTIFAWTYGQIVVLDRDRRWWYPTGQGLVRYPAVARIEELATTIPEHITNLPGRDIARIYADRRGDVWIGTMSALGTARWDRATDRVITIDEDWARDVLVGVGEDVRGDLWLGYTRHVVRVRDGKATVLPPPVTGGSGAFLVDHAGRLWLASVGEGVARIDDPDHPQIRRYRAAELGSDQAVSLVEDRQGRVYVGTSRGIARIDPASGEIVRYTTADGLPNDYVHVGALDRDGTLWFGTKGGMARLLPEQPHTPTPSRLFITRLSISGTPQPIAADGNEHLGPLELASDETALDVELASPQFAIGNRVRFQYRLGDDWSAATDERTLHFAHLAAAHYNLEMRAIDAHGVASSGATIDFTVLPPIWRRWWFITGAVLMVAMLAYAAYRRRLAHLLALERVRRRIATDLHDELGSSLSRISILSEVARSSTSTSAKLGDQLEVIGTSARELVDVASDIVWSTDPRRDDLKSLIVRLRSFGADIFDARGIAWSVNAPQDPERIKLDPERRRHLYLVLKEAINNAARHSGATRVELAISHDRGGLVASVRDNGRGFDESALAGNGNGVANMRARAEECGGTLEIRADQGTEVVLRL